MPIKITVRTPTLAFAHDVTMVLVAWFGAYFLRFNLGIIPTEPFQYAVTLVPILIVVQSFFFWYFGLYRGVWRFASVLDLIRITKAVIAGVAITTIILFFINRLEGIPRSIIPLYALIQLMLLGGPRLLYRLIKDRSLHSGSGQRTLIIGAGLAGEMMVRELLRDPGNQYHPVCFIDDDRKKLGNEIHGVRVIGNTSSLIDVIQNKEIEIILIAIPSASSKEMQEIVAACEEANITFRTLPSIQDLASGKSVIKELRDVNIDDLLGRETISLDWQSIRSDCVNKRILVTGGGGSIGSELCRQIAELSPACLIIIEQSEYNLYSIEHQLRKKYPKLKLAVYLGDVADSVLTERVFTKFKPEIVYHAAAYKHVPMLEDQARIATQNNILATELIADLANKYHCQKFILISTDKAVNPSSIMGTTKRVAEIYCQLINKSSETKYITVRFGNVLASAGSVIPLFQKQIAEGGPVTVTHPDITRYFMTIPEATQLILQAGAIGEGGEIFVLDMGEPVKIDYLARQLILLSGKKPGDDIEVVYTGLRPGEKRYEELFHPSEELMPTKHQKIMLAMSRETDSESVRNRLSELRVACDSDNDDEIKGVLARLVPESVAAAQKPETVSEDEISTIIKSSMENQGKGKEK